MGKRKGLPDLSLVLSLSEVLNVSVNELLSGERIEEEHYQEKLEENIVQTIEYSENKIRSTRKVFSVILVVIIALIIIIGSLFGIDITRMMNNEEVFFSTWGFDYFPPVDLSDEEIYIAIKEHLISQEESGIKYHEDEKSFAAINVYLLTEIEKEKCWEVDAWVLCETYYQENGTVLQDSGYSIPHKFTVERQGDEYIVTDARIPRDGSYYPEDIKDMFSWSVRRSMDKVHHDGTIDRLSLEIKEQVDLYFH